MDIDNLRVDQLMVSRIKENDSPQTNHISGPL